MRNNYCMYKQITKKDNERSVLWMHVCTCKGVCLKKDYWILKNAARQTCHKLFFFARMNRKLSTTWIKYTTLSLSRNMLAVLLYLTKYPLCLPILQHQHKIISRWLGFIHYIILIPQIQANNSVKIVTLLNFININNCEQ